MPTIELRKLRENQAIRDQVSETRISVKDLILPYFVVEGSNIRQEIKSMPSVFHLSIDNLLEDLKQTRNLGINRILLFGLPQKKDVSGSESYSKDGVVQKALRAIKKETEDIVVITDVCLCGYTSHGHCGIVKDKKIDNDASIKVLAKIALFHAQAGADFVAPSAMMDGQVRAIREALDKNGFEDTKILAYSAKYASNFYGPFRDALDSTPQFGDRKTYQMDYRNSDEALREIEQDIDEGADIVMVKPALAYLDIIYKAKQKFNVPIAAYNVSGEYSMIKKLSEGDKIKERDLALETLTSIKRAGADLIITYFGREVAKWLE
ncbi:MAG: porphobilinogen synthase [Candidatus Omnitrophota bacterium]